MDAAAHAVQLYRLLRAKDSPPPGAFTKDDFVKSQGGISDREANDRLLELRKAGVLLMGRFYDEALNLKTTFYYPPPK